MSGPNVRYEVAGQVATLTLDRPRYRNAQSWQLLDELDAGFDRAVADRDVRVVVVCGEGEHFSAGHDLGTPEQIADYEQRGIGPVGIGEYEAFRKYNLDLTLKWRNLPKPTIAMVRGYCIYGGWMIAAAMDVIFASPDARFLAGQVEYFSVPFDVGFRKAKELLFENRFIDAEEARALGFVNRVFPADQLEAETLAWASRVAESGCYRCDTHSVLSASFVAETRVDRSHSSTSANLTRGQAVPPEYMGNAPSAAHFLRRFRPMLKRREAWGSVPYCGRTRSCAGWRCCSIP